MTASTQMQDAQRVDRIDKFHMPLSARQKNKCLIHEELLNQGYERMSDSHKAQLHRNGGLAKVTSSSFPISKSFKNKF